jgi:hypothetical protein
MMLCHGCGLRGLSSEVHVRLTLWKMITHACLAWETVALVLAHFPDIAHPSL